MSAEKNVLPPWDAYRLLCAHLRRCIDPSAPVPAAPPQWEQLISLSSQHLVTPALGWCLRDDPEVPEGVREFFDGLMVLARQRNAGVEKTVSAALEAWAPAGIQSVLLKGASGLSSGLYPDSGMRIMGDADILVPAERADEALNLALEAGFEVMPSDIDYAHHHHLVPLRYPETEIGIEIHRDVLLKRFRAYLPTGIAWQHLVDADVAGRPTRRLAATEDFLHAFVHAHLVDNAYFASTISLRRLLDLALLAHRHHSEIDWTKIAEIFRARGAYPILREGVEVLVQLFGIERPAIFDTPRGDPLRALRRRVEGHFGPSEIYRATRRKIAENPARIFNVVRPGSWITYFQALSANRRNERPR